MNSGVLCFPFGGFIYWKYLYRSWVGGGCGISFFHISDDDDGQLKALVFSLYNEEEFGEEKFLKEKKIFY